MNYHRTFKSIAKLAILLLKNGAEIYRVEESVKRLCLAYGFQEIEVFALPSFLNMSAMLPDNTTISYSKRSFQNRIHMDNLCALNSLIRDVCNNPRPIEEVETEVEIIKNEPTHNLLICLGYGLTASGFTAFFGGNIIETLLALFIGFVIFGFFVVTEKLEINGIVSTIGASMTLSLLSHLMLNIGIINNLEAISIGSLMVLVPGVAITNGLRDMIGGEYISSLARLLEAVLIAASIAMGVGFITVIFGGQ